MSDPKADFYVNWENATIHTVAKDGSTSKAKSDFAIRLTSLVEAGSNTGYTADVKRKFDNNVK